MSFLLVRVLLTAVIARNQILKMSHSGIADFPALTVPVPRGTLHNYSASWSTATSQNLTNLVAFQVNEEWLTMVNPSFDFFFSKVEAFLFFLPQSFMQHVRVCKGYSAPPHEVESTRVFGA